MNNPVFDIDEGDWQRYLIDCQIEEIRPSTSDYLVWCDDNDLARPELYDGEFGAQDEEN